MWACLLRQRVPSLVGGMMAAGQVVGGSNGGRDELSGVAIWEAK